MKELLALRISHSVRVPKYAVPKDYSVFLFVFQRRFHFVRISGWYCSILCSTSTPVCLSHAFKCCLTTLPVAKIIRIKGWEWSIGGTIFTGGGSPSIREEKLLQFHLVNHKPHTDWPGNEHGPAWWMTLFLCLFIKKLAKPVGQAMTFVVCSGEVPGSELT